MTLAALRPVPDLADDAVDPRVRALGALLLDNWREGEWNADQLMLTLDPHGQQSALTECRVTECTKTSRSLHGLCAVCRRTYEQSGSGDLEAWLTTAVRASPLRGEELYRRLQCDLERDGDRCARPVRSRTVGLCSVHDTSKRAAIKRGETEAQWLTAAKPLRARPPCQASFCNDQQSFHGLCQLHYSRWTAAGRPDGIDQWVETQPPVENGLQVWLGGLPPLALSEILYILQLRDREHRNLDPQPARVAAQALRASGHESLTDLAPDTLKGLTRIWVRYAQDRLGLVYRDPQVERASDVWDLRVMGLHAGRERGNKPLTVDFTVIRQPWLRDLAKSWVETGAINRSDNVKDYILTVSMLSEAISVGPGDNDARKLSRGDIGRFMKILRESDLGGSRKGRYVGAARRFLLHARNDGWLDDVPGEFAFRPDDNIARDDSDDDDLVGRAIPDPVIRQLDQHLSLLAARVERRPLGRELSTELRVLAYTLLRDTGRRISDIAALPLNPIEWSGEECTLVYDNIKARRKRRRLPIERRTADAVARVAGLVRAKFPDTDAADLPLFPRATSNAAGTKRVDPGTLASWFEDWFDALPPLEADRTDESGAIATVERSTLYCHAFRHAYAQRHADAGTDPDVLRRLMDHTSLETTQRYYVVTAERRRRAIEQVAPLRIDKDGNSAERISATNYGRQSIAVPYGNCIEPSNVVAGGKSCPIRFQCAGCTFYRPDPSFLPAIETHIAELLTNREEAIASGAAEWVIGGIEAELAAYREIIGKMRALLARLEPARREAVEQASAVLRRSRAGEQLGVVTEPATDTARLPLLQIGRPPSEGEG